MIRFLVMATFLLPIEQYIRQTFDIKIVIYIVYGVMALITLGHHLLKREMPKETFTALVAVLVYHLWYAMSIMWSVFPSHSFEKAQTMVRWLCYFYPLLYWVRSYKDIKKILIAFCLGTIVSFIIVFFWRVDVIMSHRLSLLGNANMSAMLLGLSGIIWLFFIQIERQHFKRILMWVISSVMFITMILHGSRGGTAATIVGLLVLFMSRRKLLLVKVAGSFFIILVIANVFAADLIRHTPLEKVIDTTGSRFQAVTNPIFKGERRVDLADLSSGRLTIFKIALEAFSNKPILGIGADATCYYTVRKIGLSFDIHNEYLSALVHLGVIGFVLWVLVLYTLRPPIGRQDQLALLIKACVAVVLVMAFSGTMLSSTHFWMVMGLSLIVRVRRITLEDEDQIAYQSGNQ